MIALLTSRLAGPIASALALVLAGLLALQAVQLAGARGDLRDTRKKLAASAQDLGACSANSTSLTAALRAQNASVTALKADSDRRATMLADALQAARKDAAAANSRADRIAAIRPVGSTVCERLIDVDRKIMGAR